MTWKPSKPLRCLVPILLLMLLAMASAAPLAHAADCKPSELAYVGSGADQLLALRLDGCAGQLALVGPQASLARPRWAVAAPGSRLYVASDPAGQDGRIVAFRVDRATGALEKFDEAPAGGAGTTHLWLDTPSNTLLAAHYLSGSVTSFELDADGRLGPAASNVKDIGAGTGPTPRQQAPHAQGVVVDPSGNFALVPDLGADRVFVYPFDRISHTLVPLAAFAPKPGQDSQTQRPTRGQSGPGGRGGGGGGHGGHGGGMGGGGMGAGGHDGSGRGGADGAARNPQDKEKAEPLREFIPDPGSGPHHLVFSADGHYVYLLDELSADVTTLRWDEVQGRIAFVQSVEITSPEFQGAKGGSEIARSSDGRFVYVANRGENQLMVYAVDAPSGELSLVQRIASGGDAPWTFAIDPTGRWLLVANYASNRLDLLRIDAATGRLQATDQTVTVPSPLSIAFLNH